MANSQALQWSQECPKEPGYYWWRRPGLRGRVLNIDYHVADNRTELWSVGQACYPIRVKELAVDGEWYGPLSEPDPIEDL